jgi:hypothetical protein
MGVLNRVASIASSRSASFPGALGGRLHGSADRLSQHLLLAHARVRIHRTRASSTQPTEHPARREHVPEVRRHRRRRASHACARVVVEEAAASGFKREAWVAGGQCEHEGCLQVGNATHLPCHPSEEVRLPCPCPCPSSACWEAAAAASYLHAPKHPIVKSALCVASSAVRGGAEEGPKRSAPLVRTSHASHASKHVAHASVTHALTTHHLLHRRGVVEHRLHLHSPPTHSFPIQNIKTCDALTSRPAGLQC